MAFQGLSHGTAERPWGRKPGMNRFDYYSSSSKCIFRSIQLNFYDTLLILVIVADLRNTCESILINLYSFSDSVVMRLA
jgi:hypothetical protein